MYPILDTRVLIQNGVKLFYFACICWRSLRALLIQNGVKLEEGMSINEYSLRALLI